MSPRRRLSHFRRLREPAYKPGDSVIRIWNVGRVSDPALEFLHFSEDLHVAGSGIFRSGVRPEGPVVNRPGRQAGMNVSSSLSAEGVALVVYYEENACKGQSKLPHSK